MDEFDKKMELLLSMLLPPQEIFELPDSVDASGFIGIINSQDEESKVCNPETCKVCGGQCCKSAGCHIAPDDLKDITIDSLRELLNTGFVSIDWWNGTPHIEEGEPGYIKEYRGYYLRMRNRDAAVVDPSYGYVCNILTNTGCPLPFCNRPKGGRLLVPIKDDTDDCEVFYSKQQCCIDWLEYHDILEQLDNEYGGKDVQ